MKTQLLDRLPMTWAGCRHEGRPGFVHPLGDMVGCTKLWKTQGQRCDGGQQWPWPDASSMHSAQRTFTSVGSDTFSAHSTPLPFPEAMAGHQRGL